MAGRYKQPVQYGEGPPIKAGRPEPSPNLETACEIHHIYEDLNESSSARPGRSQQLKIPPGLNSKQAPCFSSPAGFSSNEGFYQARTRFQRPARILLSACFSVDARILKSACFSVDARISQICLIFCKCKDFSIRLIFSKSKDFSIRLIFSKSKDSSIRLIFSKSRDFSICLIFSGCKYLYIFQYFISALSMHHIQLAQLFAFRFKIDTVVKII
jgi:hypothetical protein